MVIGESNNIVASLFFQAGDCNWALALEGDTPLDNPNKYALLPSALAPRIRSPKYSNVPDFLDNISILPITTFSQHYTLQCIE